MPVELAEAQRPEPVGVPHPDQALVIGQDEGKGPPQGGEHLEQGVGQPRFSQSLDGMGFHVPGQQFGHQVAVVGGDAKAGAGSLFGLAIAPGGNGLVYVDDASNTLRVLH